MLFHGDVVHFSKGNRLSEMHKLFSLWGINKSVSYSVHQYLKRVFDIAYSFTVSTSNFQAKVGHQTMLQYFELKRGL